MQVIVTHATIGMATARNAATVTPVISPTLRDWLEDVVTSTETAAAYTRNH